MKQRVLRSLFFTTRLARQDERGSPLIELIIVLPILVLLSLNLFDIGRMLINYLSLAQFASEGVSIAEALARLEPGQFEDDTVDCYQSPRSGPPNTWVVCPLVFQHRVLQTRIRQLTAVSATGFSIDPGSIVITTEYDPTAGSETVRVSLSGTYQGLFFPYRSAVIRAQSTGPRI